MQDASCPEHLLDTNAFAGGMLCVGGPHTYYEQWSDILTKVRLAMQQWTTLVHVFHMHTSSLCKIAFF